MNVKLTEAQKIKIINSDDLYNIMQQILLRENKIDRDREHFWVIGLATNHKLLFIELISKGTINKTLVEPMEVFSLALQKRAVKIMLVHNHPTGELQPSDHDKSITDRLIQVGNIVNTQVLDHLIISEKSYLSFAETGLMEELALSTRWVPTYELEQRIKKQAIEIGKNQRNIEIAKELKKRGLTIEEISEITGLLIEDVKKIRVRKI